MSKKYLVIIIAALLIAGLVFWIFYRNNSKTKTTNISPSPTTTISVSPTPTNSSVATPTPTSTSTMILNEPVTDFKTRVTKKPFGIYITSQNSPVQPERFSGYHTGADSEYQDITGDVPVYAVADGKVVFSQIVSGYGGVLMLEIDLDRTKHTVLYGHIRPSSLPKVGQTFTKGGQIGLLGTGYSSETDNERRHLHFAILSDDRTDIKGYVQNESQLSGWLDPLTYY